ncbi:MAG TPA: hypothetical protein VN108_01910 [Marmoricola sp.]|nr:hypothetical protein [Marmoricola sp.]
MVADEERLSRCLEIANAPQHIHYAPVGGQTDAVVAELVAAIEASVAKRHHEHAVARASLLIDRITDCLAVCPDDVKAVVRYDYMWEYRIDDHAHGIQIRMYGAELPALPNTIVMLHAHAKRLDGTERQIREWQDWAISEAAMRFEAGRKDRWGIAHTDN